MEGTAPKAKTDFGLSRQQELEAARLRDEIVTLDEWIKTRTKELEKALDDHVERARHLVIVAASTDELTIEYKRTEALKKEIKSLNELRQIWELKIAMLRKLESMSSD